MSENSTESKPTVLIVPGWLDSERGVNVASAPLRRRGFNTVVVSAEWRNREKTEQQRIEQLREKIDQEVEKNGPVGLILDSASGPLGIRAAHELGNDKVGAIVTIDSPLNDPGDSISPDLIDKVKTTFPSLYDTMQKFVQDTLPNLSDAEKDRILTIRGTKYKRFSPDISTIDGAHDHQVSSFPVFSHLSNIWKAFHSNRMSEFLTEKLKR
jgi:hypothetical protein